MPGGRESPRSPVAAAQARPGHGITPPRYERRVTTGWRHLLEQLGMRAVRYRRVEGEGHHGETITLSRILPLTAPQTPENHPKSERL